MFSLATVAKAGRVRRPYIFILPVLLGQCVDGTMPSVATPVPEQRLAIASDPVVLDTTDPDRRRVGALTLLGGWQLTSGARSFGGLSALDVDGSYVTALSDAGTVVRFRLGRFGNVSGASIRSLPEGCGRVILKTDNDTESLAHDPTRQHWWVGYEWRNAICRLDAGVQTGEAVAAPPTMNRWPKKQGAEAMVRLADGRFVVIAEGAGPGDVHPLLLFDRDPTDRAAEVTQVSYRAPAGFDPTDVAQLPDGRLLVLNRRFSVWSLFTAVLVIVDPIAARPTSIVEGRVIARFEPPVVADNYEGLSVTVEGGKPIVWIVSDDNFMAWQRTLLLKFALD